MWRKGKIKVWIPWSSRRMTDEEKVYGIRYKTKFWIPAAREWSESKGAGCKAEDRKLRR